MAECTRIVPHYSSWTEEVCHMNDRDKPKTVAELALQQLPQNARVMLGSDYMCREGGIEAAVLDTNPQLDEKWIN